MTPDQIELNMAVMTPLGKGVVVGWGGTFGEMRSVMKKAGVATEEDEVAKEQIAQDTADAMALETPVNEPAE